MSVESFIQAMPKVEVNIHFDGALHRPTLLMLADQNEVRDTLKHYTSWIELVKKPDYLRLDDLTTTVMSWIKYPEDITRLVYDLGVSLAKQNVRYAEVTIDPTTFTDIGMPFEQFMEAVADGSDRARRGWQIRLAWILATPRSKPRKGDDVARWATSATGRKGNVVGLGLYGREDIPPAQFKRAFVTAEKKGIARVVYADNASGDAELLASLEELTPNRILNPWGIVGSEISTRALIEQHVPIGVSLSRAVRMGQVGKYSDYPLRQLVDADIKLFLGSDRPVWYDIKLNDEYINAVKKCGLGIDELQEIALNTVRYSFLPDDEKSSMLMEFKDIYQQLQVEHLVGEVS